jgi:uncharacterized Zn-finger protein
MSQKRPPRIVEVSEDELPLFCPRPDQSLWNAHPRVFLPISEKGEALCPYCGTHYRLRGSPRAHH